MINLKNMLKQINLFVILIALISFTGGWKFGQRDVQVKWNNYQPALTVKNQEPPKNINVDFKLFWDTWNLVSQQYVDKSKIDPMKLYYGAISGMVAAVGDPYTVFLPPDQQKSSKEDLGGSFEGVGLQLGFNKDKRLVVVAPLEGTPAKRAGVLPEDLIVKINDKDTTNMTLPEAVNQIRGQKGTQVALTLYRDGDSDTRSVNLVRDTIVVKSVIISYKENKQGKIAIIKLTRFGERTEDEWNQAISDILASGAKGVVLDMRNNPGGFLDGAVFIASEFLEGGDIVLQENSEGKKTGYKVNRVGKLINYPLVVLVNKGSASASEIVAGALQDRKRAKLVGDKSFGKGTVQEAQELAGGTGVHITIAKWLTPNGKWVNATEGLEPDIKVEVPKLKQGEISDDTVDIQLDKAVEILNQN